MTLGTMGDRPPILSGIGQVLNFRCQRWLGTRGRWGRARREAGPPARKPLPDRPGEELHSPQKIFIHGPIFAKFGTHNHGDQRPPPSKFEPNPTTLNFRPPLRACLAMPNSICQIIHSTAGAASMVRFRSKLQGRSGRSSALHVASFKSMSPGMETLHALQTKLRT